MLTSEKKRSKNRRASLGGTLAQKAERVIICRGERGHFKAVEILMLYKEFFTYLIEQAGSGEIILVRNA